MLFHSRLAIAQKMTLNSNRIRSKRLVFCLIFGLFALLSAQTTPAFARYASIVLDADTGQVLHASNPDTRNYPASLTKMMALYLVFEALKSGKLKLRQQLPVSARAAGMAPSKLGVKRGETISVETAILALVTKSANDAAVVVAEALGGTEAKFARKMTKKARLLGMQRTTFRNASGLPNRRQLSTARDMARLARCLVKDFPHRYSYFSQSSYRFRGRNYKNHNNLLRTYAGTDGVKTGYIRASGFNLAASVVRGRKRLIGVVFGGRTAKSRDKHMAKLLDKGFQKLNPVVVASKPRPKSSVKPKKAATKVASKKPVAKKQIATARPKPQRRLPKLPRKLPDAPKGWSIQVGAYKKFEPARKAVHKAIARIPKLTENTHISIAPFNAGDTLMYRARLIGLSISSARTACKRLESRKIPCVAIPPDRLNDVGASQSQTAAQPR
jgi:D-alanyl-D-alanine carboxypeptidase